MLCAEKMEDLPKVYLQMINDFTYNDLYEWSERCFPNLMFTEDSFIHAEQIGSFQDNKLDIINALETLDELMDEERKQYSEQELLEVLQQSLVLRAREKEVMNQEHSKRKYY